MEKDQFIEAARTLPPGDRAHAIAAATKELTPEGQQVVANQGIDKSAWPQESKDRMLTILGSLVIALLAAGLAIVASYANAKEIGTALVAVATAIVGGIFGYAQASK